MNALTPISWHPSVPDFLRDASAMSAVDSLGAAFESRAFARVSLNANRFSLISVEGEAMPVNQLDPETGTSFIDVVFINWSDKITKTWYATGYTDGNDAPPDCFSMDGVHPDASVAQPQSAGCAACPKNAFGSAANGSGKACGDKQRAAIVLGADTPVIVNQAAHTLKAGEQVYGFALPPMTGKNLREQVNIMKRSGVNIMGVVLRARFVAQGVVGFKALGYISADMWARTRALAASEETQRACGLLDVPAAVPALPAPPAHAQLAAPAAAPVVQAVPAPVVAPIVTPLPLPSAAPAPFVAPAPAPAPVAAAQRKRGRPAAASPAAASSPSIPQSPTTVTAPAAFPSEAPAQSQVGGFPGVAAAPPAPAPAAVIQQPVATSADLDALLASALGGVAA